MSQNNISDEDIKTWIREGASLELIEQCTSVPMDRIISLEGDIMSER